VEVRVDVLDRLRDALGVAVRVLVVDELGEGGGGVALTDAVSLPTAISTPQTSGRVSVAEYTHVGFSFTPLICIVAPHARVSLKVRLQVGLTAASGPYN
jgi:hypothetical protein